VSSRPLLPGGKNSADDTRYEPLRMSEVEFEYRLVGTGWSEARFAVGDRWVGLTASYLEDALGDLLLAVRLLAEGDTSGRASWAEEAGEYRWLLDRWNGEFACASSRSRTSRTTRPMTPGTPSSTNPATSARW
jgi:hypothetical protein